MTGKISLTASMRNNLLSLQNISRQVSATQNKLATGNKVNSAIDNPSSYYTARALNNRADDLNALLDSMGQAVSTIKAATTALETGAAFLEQAAAVSMSVSSSLGRDVFAIVSNKAELVKAVEQWSDGNGLIVVSEDIDMGNTRLELKNNQKIVGLNYLDGSQRRAELKFEFKAGSSDGRAIITSDNNFLSDLKISYTSDNIDYNNKTFTAVYNNGGNIKLHNMDISVNHSSVQNENRNGDFICGIKNQNRGQITLSGAISFNVSSIKFYGLAAISHENTDCQLLLEKDARLMVQTKGTYGAFMRQGTNIFLGDVIINYKSGNASLVTNANNSFYGRLLIDRGGSSSSIFRSCNTDFYGDVAIKLGGHNECVLIGGSCNIYGKFAVSDYGGSKGTPNSFFEQMTLNVKSSAELLTKRDTYSYLCRNPGNKVTFEAGAKVGNLKDGVADSLYQAAYDTEYTTPNDLLDDFNQVEGLQKIGEFPQEEFNHFLSSVDNEVKTAGQYESELNDATLLSSYMNSLPKKEEYDKIISEYDALMNDASYQGVNLLTGGELNITFNESRSHSYQIKGRDMRTASLGLNQDKWQNQEDVVQAMNELTKALNSIRTFSAELGNNYSIITSRQDFTENLINILTEGADKLTLADMNEESANMLALQTRQQLAINSLSLASQASQSILRLF